MCLFFNRKRSSSGGGKVLFNEVTEEDEQVIIIKNEAKKRPQANQFFGGFVSTFFKSTSDEKFDSSAIMSMSTFLFNTFLYCFLTPFKYCTV